MTHHITDEQIDELCLSLTGTYTRKERDRAVARAVLALAAPHGEPYGWAVTGCHSLYRGEWAESTAQAEARRCGGTAMAFPLYTAPAVPSDAGLRALVRDLRVIAETTLHASIEGSHRAKERDTVLQAIAALTAAPTPPAQSAVPEVERNCTTCAHGDLHETEEPCATCFLVPHGFPEWKPESTTPQAQQPAVPEDVAEALRDGLSVCRSVSTCRDRKIVRDGVTLYAQTEEWCRWLEDEVGPKIETALEHIDAARAAGGA